MSRQYQGPGKLTDIERARHGGLLLRADRHKGHELVGRARTLAEGALGASARSF